MTQTPFATFMQQTVLEPVGLASMTYEKPLPMELRPRAATELGMGGQPFAGKRLHSPHTAAGGMWTTPSDLARVAIEIMRAYAGDSDRFISPQTAREMLTPQVEVTEGPLAAIADAVGLGFDPADEEGRLRMPMTGGTWGSTCVLWAFPETGDGAVLMTNSARGTMLNFELVAGLGVEYGWIVEEGSSRLLQPLRSRAEGRLVWSRLAATPPSLLLEKTWTNERQSLHQPLGCLRAAFAASSMSFFPERSAILGRPPTSRGGFSRGSPWSSWLLPLSPRPQARGIAGE